MKIIYAGCKERGKACLEALLKKKENITHIITQESKENPIKAIAKKHKIPVFEPKNINDPLFVKKIKSLHPDLLILVSYTPILKKPIIDVPKKGVINLHGGKLPEYRGASPTNWQIINGEKTAGICILYAKEGIDEGDILAQKRFPIKDSYTIKDIIQKTVELFPGMLVKVVKQIKNGIQKPIKQNLRKGKYYGSRRPEDGLINFNEMTAKNVYDFVRALTHPLPGAFTYHNNKKLFVWKASLLKKKYIHQPGKVFLKRAEGVIVMAKDQGILLESVQREGGKILNAKNYFTSLGDYLKEQ